MPGSSAGLPFLRGPGGLWTSLSVALVQQEFQSPASCLSRLVLALTPIPPFPVPF